MDESMHERIREAVASVPQGYVASYGDIAELAGASTPRIVGWVLKEDGFDLPWHRIVRVDGTPPPHKRQEQLGLLRSEEHTSELQSRFDIVCRLLLEKKNIEMNFSLC